MLKIVTPRLNPKQKRNKAEGFRTSREIEELFPKGMSLVAQSFYLWLAATPANKSSY